MTAAQKEQIRNQKMIVVDEDNDEDVINFFKLFKEEMKRKVFVNRSYGVDCFYGADAIPALCKLLGGEHEEDKQEDEDEELIERAIHMGDVLMQKKYIFHVTHQKGFCSDGDVIFQFNGNWKVASIRNQWMQREKTNRNMGHLAKEVKTLQRKFQDKERTPRRFNSKRSSTRKLRNSKFYATLPDTLERSPKQMPADPLPSPVKQATLTIDPELRRSIRKSIVLFDVEVCLKLADSGAPAAPLSVQTDDAFLETKRSLERVASMIDIPPSPKSKRHSLTITTPRPETISDMKSLDGMDSKRSSQPQQPGKLSKKLSKFFTGMFKPKKLSISVPNTIDYESSSSDEEGAAPESIKKTSTDPAKSVPRTSSTIIIPELMINPQFRRSEANSDKFLPMVSYRRRSRRCSLLKMLHHEDIRQQFKSFATAELSDENVVFWELLETQYKLLAMEEDRKEFAAGLFKMFLSGSSPYCLNLPAHVSKEVKQTYNSGSRKAFYYAQIAVEESMQDTFKRFKATSQYQKWISTQRQSIYSPEFNNLDTLASKLGIEL